MKSHLFFGKADTAETLASTRITISKWVNEQSLPWNQILSAHDVARLTRRKRWVCVGLTWLGRFPRKKRFQGRAVGWLKSEVLEWMTRDLRLFGSDIPRPMSGVARSHGRQQSLPFEFMGPCPRRRRRSRRPANRKALIPRPDLGANTPAIRRITEDGKAAAFDTLVDEH
jgi:predicted DNA-binding transcriptional regulator AlpA